VTASTLMRGERSPSESTVSRILGHESITGTSALSGIYDRFD
jgi:hypothetical protein